MHRERIDTPTARARLAPRREPYWHMLDKGRYVGFRAGAGTWIARCYRNGANTYAAIDAPPPRDFSEAKRAAERWFRELDGRRAEAPSHYTGKRCIDDYVENLRTERGDDAADDAKRILYKSAIPDFGDRNIATLSTADFTTWRNRFVPKAGDDEAKRRARDTANRHWSALRAALAFAFRQGNIADDAAWRRVRTFQNVGRARDFYPTPAQVAELLKHADGAFRPLARALALTGFRLQALTGAKVGDFDPDAGTLTITRDKKHARIATLSTAAVALFSEQARDKLPGAHLFMRPDGLPWGKSHQHRPMREACARAKLPREFIVYSLRHYFVSRALLAGMNVHALAKAVGTSAAMIEKHYGKFIRGDVRDMLDRVEVA